jgi:hypothetical protein
MMLLGIDHLVIAVADPDAAAITLEADLGLAVTGGGRHERAGTWNRLAFLGDTYLELIGVFDRALVLANRSFAVGRATLAVLDAGHEGLATYALAVDDTARAVVALQAAGSRIGDPVMGSRVRPDGEVVRWTTAFPALGPAEPPFLIEHEAEGAEWGVPARKARARFRHPTGGRVRLASLVLPVADPDAVAGTYRREVGLDATNGSALVGVQAIALTRGRAGATPIVSLVADAGTPALDVVRFGIRWLRLPADHGGG